MSRLFDWPGHSWLALPARLYLGLIFVLACAHKIAQPGSFAVDIATYDILPLSLVNLMAVTLPWVELVVGVMLIIGLRVRGAALVVTGMMMMFTVALGIALSKGLDMSCGCFASESVVNEDPISSLTIVRDIFWLVLAVYVTLFDRNAIGFERLMITGKRDV